MANRLVAEEFTHVGPIDFITGHGEVFENVEYELAAYIPELGIIFFNTTFRRKWYRRTTDNDLSTLLRHELLHAELEALGVPSNDSDTEFIREAIERGIYLNIESEADFDDKMGKGAFEKLVYQKSGPVLRFSSGPRSRGKP
jgi:hypothetical protein